MALAMHYTKASADDTARHLGDYMKRTNTALVNELRVKPGQIVGSVLDFYNKEIALLSECLNGAIAEGSEEKIARIEEYLVIYILLRRELVMPGVA